MKAKNILLAPFFFLIIGSLGMVWLPAVETRADSAVQIKIRFIEPAHFEYYAENILGALKWHRIRKKESLLDIARKYDLGFNEIRDLYPDLDPWTPPEGKELIIPSRWILPDSSRKGIVINIPEMRLFFFKGSGKRLRVKTFPIGIGDLEFPTPVGTYAIGSKRTNPAWFIPLSLQAKYGVKVLPPGPENPLGDYWMNLAGSSYGIHGTDIPWSVGRLVTHGCIRLYPEDIEVLYPMVKIGTKVEIIYDPVKIALVEERIYVEVHQDIYNKIDDFVAYGESRLMEKGLGQRVDRGKFLRALERRDGMSVDITE